MPDTKQPWTLKYEHAHGVDETDYATEELAEKGACHLIVSWWSDIDDAGWRSRIAAKLVEKDWAGARETWAAYQEWHEDEYMIEREYMSINQRDEPVTDVPDPVPPETQEEDE